MNSPKMLRVATFPIRYITEIHTDEFGDTYMSGLEGEYVDLILTTLGLKYRVVIPDDKEWGRLIPNGNWSGIIGMLQRGEADFGFNTLKISEQREQVVDFSNAYTADGLKFVSHAPGSIPSIFAYIYPFEVKLWIAIFVSLMVLSIFCKLFDINSSCGQSVFRLLPGLLRQPLKMDHGTLKCKLIIVTWSLFCIVISCSYSAAFHSFLTVPLRDEAIENFHQLSQAVQKGTHKCYSLKGSSQISELLSSNSQKRILGEAIESNSWYNNISDVIAGRQINRHSSVLFTRLLSKLFFGPQQDKMMFSKEVIYVGPLAIALSKSFCCKTKLNLIISRLSSAGIYEKLLRDQSQKISLGRNSDDIIQKPIKKLSLIDTSGCFLLLLIGLVFATITFLG